ncbi:hypothetical protein AMTR_s00072p00101810 [Amborella trichopoda]|uniref:Uncharacterized protein n=1 Tax=Amborella trichopoda TaxID=13333 RepID=W1NPA4_AMBTC|nr:hypothetical protein AMTR_s00072p00101810 [Amborella trichopoda]
MGGHEVVGLRQLLIDKMEGGRGNVSKKDREGSWEGGHHEGESEYRFGDEGCRQQRMMKLRLNDFEVVYKTTRKGPGGEGGGEVVGNVAKFGIEAGLAGPDKRHLNYRVCWGLADMCQVCDWRGGGGCVGAMVQCGAESGWILCVWLFVYFAILLPWVMFGLATYANHQVPSPVSVFPASPLGRVCELWLLVGEWWFVITEVWHCRFSLDDNIFERQDFRLVILKFDENSTNVVWL